jgi:hypothetical protein
MHLVTMVTIKHATFTYYLLSQLYCYQDPNVFLTEEVTCPGLGTPASRTKINNYPAVFSPTGISFFTSFLTGSPFGRNKVGRTDGWMLAIIQYKYIYIYIHIDGWKDSQPNG